MIIIIPRMGEKVERRFRGIETLFKRIQFTWAWGANGTAKFSLDEVPQDGIKTYTRGKLDYDSMADIISLEDLKSAIENSLNDIGHHSRGEIESLADLLDSFSWEAVYPATGSRDWGSLHYLARDKGV